VVEWFTTERIFLVFMKSNWRLPSSPLSKAAVIEKIWRSNGAWSNDVSNQKFHLFSRRINSGPMVCVQTYSSWRKVGGTMTRDQMTSGEMVRGQKYISCFQEEKTSDKYSTFKHISHSSWRKVVSQTVSGKTYFNFFDEKSVVKCLRSNISYNYPRPNVSHIFIKSNGWLKMIRAQFYRLRKK
jgi:hypothetical protein